MILNTEVLILVSGRWLTLFFNLQVLYTVQLLAKCTDSHQISLMEKVFNQAAKDTVSF